MEAIIDLSVLGSTIPLKNVLDFFWTWWNLPPSSSFLLSLSMYSVLCSFLFPIFSILFCLLYSLIYSLFFPKFYSLLILFSFLLFSIFSLFHSFRISILFSPFSFDFSIFFYLIFSFLSSCPSLLQHTSMRRPPSRHSRWGALSPTKTVAPMASATPKSYCNTFLKKHNRNWRKWFNIYIYKT